MVTLPEQFVCECRERGENPLNAWFALGDHALDRLLTVARDRPDGVVRLADSEAIAREVFSRFGEEVVSLMTVQTLTYGVGKRLWDMEFIREDGSPVPVEEVQAELDRHSKDDPEGSPWEWGAATHVRWVLRGEPR